MKRTVALLVVIGSLVFVPSSAGASQNRVVGWCEYNRISDTVSLVARAEGTAIRGLSFGYRARSLTDPERAEFDTLGEYRITYYEDHNNYGKYRFRSVPRPASGWVYRLDVYIPQDSQVYRRLAFYNDDVTRPDTACRVIEG
jgi:hypothetical protein